MATDKNESLSDTWNARFDDRDDEELAWHVWSQRLEAREMAWAQPIRNFSMPEDVPVRENGSDSKPSS